MQGGKRKPSEALSGFDRCSVIAEHPASLGGTGAVPNRVIMKQTRDKCVPERVVGRGQWGRKGRGIQELLVTKLLLGKRLSLMSLSLSQGWTTRTGAEWGRK